MEQYTKPEIEIVELEKEDTILTSNCQNCDGWTYE